MADSDAIDRKLIYVVEDDEGILGMVRLLLSSSGFAVVTETNADNVMRGVEDLQPDLILLDVMLPSREGLDGFELCARIKARRDLARIPVILTSAIGEGLKFDPEKSRQQVGADEFVQKPFDPNYLLACVRRLVN